MSLKDDKEVENIVVKNEEIHENDVLMGRGGKNNRHVGNEKLRDIARGQVEKYKVSTKKVKSAISRDIVKQVRTLDPPGRFLKRVAETGEWEDVGDYLAREKVAQVLRDAVCEAAEAMRPSIHPVMYATAPPYIQYPDGRVAAGVFRQGPMSTMDPMAIDDEARRSAIPGVVTASASSSFGHPAGYHIAHPWHPYSPHPNPQQPYAFIHPGQRPFPPPPSPGYHPVHPARFVVPAAAAHASAAYMSGRHPSMPRQSSPSGEPSKQPVSSATPATPAQPTQTPAATKTQGTSPLGPAYSISLSVAAAPGTTPVAARTEAYMWHPPAHYATPVHAKKASRKRSRSLPPAESPDKATPTESEGSSSASKSSSAQKTSATQTPTFFVEYDPAAAKRPTPVASQAPPPTLWDQATQPTVAFPASQERVYFEQHSQHYYEQSSFHPPHLQPPVRSFSAPLMPTTAAGTGDSKDSDSSGNSVVQRSRQSTAFSVRKVPRRVTRPAAASAGSFETITPPEQPGGSGTMEPLPVQQDEDGSPEKMTVLPNPQRERPSRPSGSRHRGSGRTNHPSNPTGGTSEAELGFDWFQGELLLESDEDGSEQGNKDNYPV